MASSDLREELNCSICLNIFTDPVMLNCGHNYCQVCIDRVFDSQGESGDYFCPQCRKEFQERPSPHRNTTLRNITERFLSFPPPEPDCTYCIYSSVPAVKYCLLCEASLCDDHLRVHRKSPEHVICDPTSTPENTKCPVHKKILEYYCTEDSTCICISCSLAGEHQGHQVETLQEASIKKKNKLINNLQKLITKRGKKVERMQKLMQKVQGQVDGEIERVTGLLRERRKRLEDLEEKVLGEIYNQQVDLKMEDLFRRKRPVEELCAMTDPLTVLQEPDSGDLGDTEDGDDEDIQSHEERALDLGEISHVLQSGFLDVISGVIEGIYIPKAVNMLLDEDTAHNFLLISNDKKSASKTVKNQNRPDTERRFVDFYQVLGNWSFSSGRHYWEVDVRHCNNWIIGMCYDCISRDRNDSVTGRNDVSWGLDRNGKTYLAAHDDNWTGISVDVPVKRVRVYLDYEAGQISFYMCDPLCHLHTFTATFTEPLYAVLAVCNSRITLA